MKRVAPLLFALAILLFSGCKKDVDPKVTSQYITVQPSDWHYVSSNGAWTVNLTNYAITQDVLDNGTVQCFNVGTLGTGGEYLEPLPITLSGVDFLCFAYVGTEEIDVMNTSANAQFDVMKFKVVVTINK